MLGWGLTPAPHSNWVEVLQGRNDLVPKELAESLWNWYLEAMWQLAELALPQEEEATASSLAKAVEELNWVTRRFDLILGDQTAPIHPDTMYPSHRWLSAQERNRETYGIAMCAYCIWCIDCCMVALLAGDSLLAIKACAFAGDALRLAEVQCVALGRSRLSQLALSRNAKAGADKTHLENRRMKAEVFEWLDENMAGFRSMDSAAETISQRIAPVKFRTARDWVGAWKKLRSASKP